MLGRGGRNETKGKERKGDETNQAALQTMWILCVLFGVVLPCVVGCREGLWDNVLLGCDVVAWLGLAADPPILRLGRGSPVLLLRLR